MTFDEFAELAVNIEEGAERDNFLALGVRALSKVPGSGVTVISPSGVSPKEFEIRSAIPIVGAKWYQSEGAA